MSWYPHRTDHPDYPGSTTDSALESIPTEGGADTVVEWARKRFEASDRRVIAEVLVEEGVPEDELEALQVLFDEAGAPAVVKAAIARRSADLLPWAMLIKAPATRILDDPCNEGGLRRMGCARGVCREGLRRTAAIGSTRGLNPV